MLCISNSTWRPTKKKLTVPGVGSSSSFLAHFFSDAAGSLYGLMYQSSYEASIPEGKDTFILEVKVFDTVRYTKTNNCPHFFLPSLFSLIFISKYIGLYALSRPRSNLDTIYFLTFKIREFCLSRFDRLSNPISQRILLLEKKSEGSYLLMANK